MHLRLITTVDVLAKEDECFSEMLGPFHMSNDAQCVSSVFSDGFYHLDQKSMTGIILGVCVALTCIIICALILVCRGKDR